MVNQCHGIATSDPSPGSTEAGETELTQAQAAWDTGGEREVSRLPPPRGMHNWHCLRDSKQQSPAPTAPLPKQNITKGTEKAISELNWGSVTVQGSMNEFA